MVILTLIVSLLAVIVSRTSDIWRSTEGDNQRRATGRALLQFFARDLEMARLQMPYPRANSANLRFIANAPSQIPDEYLNPHAIFWQAPVAINKSKGDLATIGYFVRWDTTSQPGTAKGQLCRFLVDPAESAHYKIYSLDSAGDPVNWLDAATIDSVASATASQEYRGWFADNVIALWLRCLDSDGNPIMKAADGTELNSGYGFNSNEGYVSFSSTKKRPAPALPVSIEIALVIVDPHTAKRIKAPISAAPTSPATFWKDSTTPGSLAHFVAGLPPEIQPGVRVFSTRVFLKTTHP